ncbi:MAG: sulfoxide reductase heme-binding subunit YedZ [Anaerolineales bacterium]|nr:sulfoxide reductase heme-binding subunit YedZ [Anaerolineales bacterium]
MKFFRRYTPLQIAVHLYAWSSLVWALFQLLTNSLPENPAQELERQTGRHALALLALALSCTPLHFIFKIPELLKRRRALGLYALLFAALHILLFVHLENSLAWSRLAQTLKEKPYILVGAAAFLMLLPMGVTSFDVWKIRLGKNWKRLHQIVYFAAPLVVVHFFWSEKLDALHSVNDALRLWIYGLVVAALLLLRAPSIRRRAAAFSAQTLTRRFKKKTHPKADST